MSNVSVTCAGEPGWHCFVPLDGVSTCGELQARVCAELGVDVTERDVVYIGCDGEEMVLEGDALLGEVGVRGVEEQIEVRPSVRASAQAYLRGMGVDGADSAWTKFEDLFRVGYEVLGEDQELALQIAASGWVATQKTHNSSSALHVVASSTSGDAFTVQTIDALIKAGQHVDVADTDGATALFEASHWGHTAVAETLIAHGANVGVKDQFGATALMYGSRVGHAAVVERLIAHGAEVDVKCALGWTALTLASMNGHEAVVEKLITHGAKVEVKDRKGATALMYSARLGFAAIVERLIAHGAEVGLRDNIGRTARMYAAENDQEAIVELLSKH